MSYPHLTTDGQKNERALPPPQQVVHLLCRPVGFLMILSESSLKLFELKGCTVFSDPGMHRWTHSPS